MRSYDGVLAAGNILLQSSDESSEDFVAKIADFGLSRWQTHGKLTEVTGTPSYLSPEVLRGDPPSQVSKLLHAGKSILASMYMLSVLGLCKARVLRALCNLQC